jgi:glucose-1-phosphate thymidylyltransferase
MKIIIPVAGVGTKLRPHTYTQPKPLIPLAGRTILSIIIDQFLDVGENDFIFIIGYLGEKIQDYVIEKYPQIKATFVVQQERIGTGHAINLTKEFIESNEPVMIVYGDTICDYDLKEVIASEISLVGIRKVDDPRNFGVAEINAEGRILHVVEKPKIPKSNMAMVGIYKIIETRLMFECIERDLATLNNEEEYLFTHALDKMLKHGAEINTFQVNNWFDCGKKETLLETNATLLSKFEYASDEVPFFDNSIIIHPVSIAEGCEIVNSIIGPNVSIGEKAKIENSIITDSIIGSYSSLKKVVLHASLIGSDAVVVGNNQSLNIGDNTEIDLS